MTFTPSPQILLTAEDTKHLEESVARGAAWLDKHRPGWVDYVEVQEFDIESACDCVLGQVFADEAGFSPEKGAIGEDTGYDVGIDFAHDIVAPGDEDWEHIHWSIEHGFDAPNWFEWKPLGDIWLRLINERKAQR